LFFESGSVDFPGRHIPGDETPNLPARPFADAPAASPSILFTTMSRRRRAPLSVTALAPPHGLTGDPTATAATRCSASGKTLPVKRCL